MCQAASCSYSRGMYRAASCSRSRGSAPSAALGRLEDGAPAPHEHLRRGLGACAAADEARAPHECLRREWLATPRERDAAGGFVLILAGECPLFSAWGRFEDGAPAPHEHLRCCGVRAEAPDW